MFLKYYILDEKTNLRDNLRKKKHSHGNSGTDTPTGVFKTQPTLQPE